MTDDKVWSRLGLARGEPSDQPRKPIPMGWRLHFPNTLRTVYQDGTGQSPVFEPALLHFPNAYRAGDPRFEDESLAQRWLTARRTALDTVLEAVSSTAGAGELMLRGSVLLRSWYPTMAREPGDLDFVVLSDAWEVSDPRTDVLFEQIARTAELLGTRESALPVCIEASGATSDDIWTYDRVPGRRLVLPWRAEGTPGGWVQLDFVFGEPLPLAPEPAVVTAGSGRPGVPLQVASKQLSLAWKLVWLMTDMHPQGKDLYDAVLLAEDTPLDYGVLRDALVHADASYYRVNSLGLSDLAELEVAVGWDHFRGEYPFVTGTADDWLLRLCLALEPTFTLLADQPASPYELYAAWIAPLVAQIADETDDRGDRLQELLVEKRIGARFAVVITRELVGREQMSIAEAVRTVLSVPRRFDPDQSSYDHLWALEKAARTYGLELRQPWPAHLAASPVAAQVHVVFPSHIAESALEILAPLATDPDPRISADPVLRAVVKLSAGRLDLLHYAIQQARTDPSKTVEATEGI